LFANGNIKSPETHFPEGQPQELLNGAFTEESTVCNHCSGSSEKSPEERVKTDVNLSQWLPSKNLEEESLTDNSPLDAPDRNNPVERESSLTLSLHECHQKAETDEDHNIDILEACIYI